MNTDIEINAYTFVNKQGIKSVPRAITVEDRRYNFVDSGLQYLVKQGQHLIRLFDLSDGQQLFRLRLEDGQWTLVNQKALV